MANKKLRKKKKFKIKETKLIDLNKLRIVKDIHINGKPFNVEGMKLKKLDMIKQVEKNKGIYPKQEAILVYRDKDPKDRRRVIYKVEDGYRRYVISKELSLDKVYVSVIEEGL